MAGCRFEEKPFTPPGGCGLLAPSPPPPPRRPPVWAVTRRCPWAWGEAVGKPRWTTSAPRPSSAQHVTLWWKATGSVQRHSRPPSANASRLFPVRVGAAAATPGGGHWQGAAQPPFGASRGLPVSEPGPRLERCVGVGEAVGVHSPGWQKPCWGCTDGGRSRLCQPSCCLPPESSWAPGERAAGWQVVEPPGFFTAGHKGLRAGLTGEGKGEGFETAALSLRAALSVARTSPEASRCW